MIPAMMDRWMNGSIDRYNSGGRGCPNIWNRNGMRRHISEENGRDESVTKRSTAGGLQMPGDYGVYPPAGYRSHCSLGVERNGEERKVGRSRLLRLSLFPRRRIRGVGRKMKIPLPSPFQFAASQSVGWQMKSNVTLLAARRRGRGGYVSGVSFGK